MTLLYIEGFIKFPSYQDFCSKNRTSPDRAVFIFPGNAEHHRGRHNLFSVKGGGGLAVFAGELGNKELPVLSLPTTGMGDYATNMHTQKIVHGAMADLWKAAGAGYDLILPVRRFKDPGSPYFEKPLAGTGLEPSFWGQNLKTPNLPLARFYTEQLDVLASFLLIKGAEAQASFLTELEKKQPAFAAAYRAGQKMEQDDPWLQKPSGKSNPSKSMDNNTIRIKAIKILLKQFNHSDYNEEGLFRISPSEKDKKAIVEMVLKQNFNVLESIGDPHLKAGVLKHLLRDLKYTDKQPLFNNKLRDLLLKANDETNEEKKLALVRTVINDLSVDSQLILQDIFRICVEVSQNKTNKMDAASIAVVIAPNLFNDDEKNPLSVLAIIMIFTYMIEACINKEKLLVPQESGKHTDASTKTEDTSEISPDLFSDLKKEIEVKDWDVGILGGKTVDIGNNKTKVMPHHVAALYEVCKRSNPASFKQDIQAAKQIISQRDIPEGVLDWVKSILKKLDVFNLFSRQSVTEQFYMEKQRLFTPYKESKSSEDEPRPASGPQQE